MNENENTSTPNEYIDSTNSSSFYSTDIDDDSRTEKKNKSENADNGSTAQSIKQKRKVYRSQSMPKLHIILKQKTEIKKQNRISYPNLNINFKNYPITFQKEKPIKNNSQKTSKPNPKPIDHLDPEFHLDLSLIIVEGFDSDNDSSRMPPNLREMVTEPKGTPTYLALCGNDISGYNRTAVENALSRLKYYQKACILHGFIQDSAYIEEVIFNLNIKIRELDTFDIPSICNAEEQLDEAINKYDKKETQWKKVDSQISASEEIVLNELFLKYQNDLEDLDAEWNSPTKINQFNKPSNKLVELRMSAKNLMKQHRFTESAQVFNMITKQEKKEQQEAGRRMQEAYNLAQRKLREKYFRDVESKKLQFEKKRNALMMKKKASLTPLCNRVLKAEQNVNKIIETEKKLQNKEKRNRANSSFGMISDCSANSTCTNSVYQSRAASRLTLRAPKNSNQKLKLPPINPSYKLPLSNVNSRPISSNKNILSNGKNNPHISRPDSRMAMRKNNLQNNMY